MIKIAKFGGSSVASAKQFRKVKGIVESDPDRRFVVVSAAGKRFSGDNKITDLLLLVNAHVQYHVDCTALLADIQQRFQDIADELGLKWPVAEKFEAFARNIKKHSPEYVVSRGEWFTANLMAEYLGLPFVDAADVMVFHHDGSVDMERTAVRLKDVMVRNGSFVLPGFYGATVDGQIKLFDRGGGDITGAILARCINADLYENWTDVSGFLSADPRIVDNPRSIKRITFDEMRELSYMGASVLQEEAIFPVREVNIPIQIKNTNRPQDEGTIIRESAEVGEDEHLITGIAGKRDFVSVHIKKAHMSGEVGLVRKTLAIFERYGVSVEHIPTGVDSFGVIVNGADVRNSIYSIISDIRKEINPDDVSMVDKLALLSVVGRNMSKRSGTSGKVFAPWATRASTSASITQSPRRLPSSWASTTRTSSAIKVIYDRFVADEMVCAGAAEVQ